MTPGQARTARWITVVVLGLASVAVVVAGGSLWWIGLMFILLVILSVVFGRYEAR